MSSKPESNNPLGEVFGFPISNLSNQSKRYREQRLCPFNNKVPNCTKDKAKNPLGVCSIIHKGKPVITCPVRFREDWVIIENAAKFVFDKNENWTSLSEIRLVDKDGQSAGNIDYVLVSYDNNGKIVDFASLEVQGVYISGNLRSPFDSYMNNQSDYRGWEGSFNYPKPDYLSSSRKRLIPQLVYKGGIFKFWNKKQMVALQKSFFDTLPKLPVTSKENAEMAWFLYDLELNVVTNRYEINLVDTIYTGFESALSKITTPNPGVVDNFLSILQQKLDDALESTPPDTPTLSDVLNS